MNDAYFKIENNLSMINYMNNAIHEISKGSEDEKLATSLYGISEVISQQLKTIENELRGND